MTKNEELEFYKKASSDANEKYNLYVDKYVILIEKYFNLAEKYHKLNDEYIDLKKAKGVGF